jgi:hypothetical protein
MLLICCCGEIGIISYVLIWTPSLDCGIQYWVIIAMIHTAKDWRENSKITAITITVGSQFNFGNGPQIRPIAFVAGQLLLVAVRGRFRKVGFRPIDHVSGIGIPRIGGSSVSSIELVGNGGH